MNDFDLNLLHQILAAVQRVCTQGNHPFGAVLAVIPGLCSVQEMDRGPVNKSQSI
jgi:hypothetical protein